jgi:hypothetical protein
MLKLLPLHILQPGSEVAQGKKCHGSSRNSEYQNSTIIMLLLIMASMTKICSKNTHAEGGGRLISSLRWMQFLHSPPS